MKKSVSVQLKSLFASRDWKTAWIIMLSYASISFLYIFWNFRGVDVSAWVDANESVCYSMTHPLYNAFLFLYPFVIVLPFSTSYLDDYNNQLLPVYLSRISRKSYYYSKLIACFIGVFLTVGIPLVYNTLLCNLLLPHSGYSYSLGGWQSKYFSQMLLGQTIISDTFFAKLPFLRLFLTNRLLYNLLYVGFYSGYAALLATLVAAISFRWKPKKIVLFFPLFVVLYLLRVIDSFLLNLAAVGSVSYYFSLNLDSYFAPSYGAVAGWFPPFFLFVTIVLLFAIIRLSRWGIAHDLESLQ